MRTQWNSSKALSDAIINVNDSMSTLTQHAE
jgi:hypothetical protein